MNRQDVEGLEQDVTLIDLPWLLALVFLAGIAAVMGALMNCWKPRTKGKGQNNARSGYGRQ